MFLGGGLTYMLESNLQDSARSTFLDFPGGPLTHDEQHFLKKEYGNDIILLIIQQSCHWTSRLDKFLLFGLAANDAWNDDKKTDEGDAPQCYC